MNDPVWPLQVRCPSCNQRHFDATGIGSIITVKCRCGITFRWPSLTPEIVPGQKFSPALGVEGTNGTARPSPIKAAPMPAT